MRSPSRTRDNAKKNEPEVFLERDAPTVPPGEEAGLPGSQGNLGPQPLTSWNPSAYHSRDRGPEDAYQADFCGLGKMLSVGGISRSPLFPVRSFYFPVSRLYNSLLTAPPLPEVCGWGQRVWGHSNPPAWRPHGASPGPSSPHLIESSSN